MKAYRDLWIDEKIFRDPVHNYIHIQHQVILDLINSTEMQRLRRIKQLGVASFLFHGAEHSRFSHSLGVYENARHICDIFARRYPTSLYLQHGWDDAQRLVTLCAALLHDVGHGAYSHAFESIFHTNHEEITVDIITNPEGEVCQILQRISPDFPEKVASVIQKTYPNPQVVQMISSQIDADRMDYLLRDAYFTGTQYGCFDITRINRVIRPYDKGIAFLASGMHAVEDYIVSRYQMYQQIYFHPTSRSMEVLLQHLLNRAHALYPENKAYFRATAPRLIPFFEEKYTLSDYLWLDDGVLNTYFGEWLESRDAVLSNLANRFRNRKPFKSARILSGTEEHISQMRKLTEKEGYLPEYYTAVNASRDLPYDFYRPEEKYARTQIEIMMPDGRLEELSTLSPLVKSLTGQSIGDERFYFPKEMLGIPAFEKYIRNGEI